MGCDTGSTHLCSYLCGCPAAAARCPRGAAGHLWGCQLRTTGPAGTWPAKEAERESKQEWRKPKINILEVHRDVNSRGKNDTERDRRKSPCAVKGGKKWLLCQDAVEGDTLKASSISQALVGSGRVQQKQPELTALQIDSCQLQKHRNKQEWTILLYVDRYINTLWSWHLSIGAIRLHCLDEKASSQLLTHETRAHSWVTGCHKVSRSVVLWGRACRFNTLPHLQRGVFGPSLVLAVLFPLLNSCQHDCSSDTLWVTSSC